MEPLVAATAASVPAAADVIDVGMDIGGRSVLRGVAFAARAGTCTALLGENGAGKSTLLRVLATLTSPTRGRVEWFGGVSARDKGAIRARIGLVGHATMLYEDLTALENLEFFGRLHRVPQARVRALALLDALGLPDRSRSLVRSLSRGMSKRVAIARAMLHEPDLLLLDEPFSGLDATAAERVLRVVGECRERGCAVVLTGHGPGAIVEVVDDVVVLAAGRVVLASPAGGTTPEQVVHALGGVMGGRDA